MIIFAKRYTALLNTPHHCGIRLASGKVIIDGPEVSITLLGAASAAVESVHQRYLDLQLGPIGNQSVVQSALFPKRLSHA